MENAVKKRDIKVVWHFTRRENLAGIIEHGLISRLELEKNKCKAIFTDDVRLDGHEDAICGSITFPNYKMFYRLRKDYPDDEWVVIALCSSILWEKDCGFCIENAAKSKMAMIPLQTKKSLQSFDDIFAEIEGKPSRAELRLEDFYPTNPQAEVLIFDRIEPKYIIGVVCEKDVIANELSKQFANMDIQKIPKYFNARHDYARW